MTNTLTVLLIIVFIIIFLQDYKDRMVYWFLYPIVGVLSYIIHILNIGFISSTINSVINFVFIIVLISVAYLYTKFILHRDFVNNSIGLGDILLFIFLCFSFAIYSFIILLVFSLIFSLLLHFSVKTKQRDKTVPLAGYMSLFFAGIYCTSLFMNTGNLFAF